MEIIQDDQGKPTRLFEGRVKCILSGDTMIIWPTGTKSGSVEREITLSLCMAPRMGKMPRILDVSEFKEEVIKKKLIYSSKKKKNFLYLSLHKQISSSSSFISTIPIFISFTEK